MAATTASLAIEHYTGKAMTVLYAIAAGVALWAVAVTVACRWLGAAGRARDRGDLAALADAAGERLHEVTDGDLDAMMQAYDGQHRP